MLSKTLEYGPDAYRAEQAQDLELRSGCPVLTCMLTAGIAAWDAIRLFDVNDDNAAFAMAMVATGTAVSTIAGTFITASSTTFGLGPIAWFGVALSLSGFLLYLFFKDSEMEIWLKNGPFSEKTSTKLAFLKQPDKAFHYFISQLMSLSITTYKSDNFIHEPERYNTFKKLGATHAIFVRTNLLQLINSNKVKIHFYAREAIRKITAVTTRTGRSTETSLVNISSNNTAVLKIEDTQEGRLYYLKHNKKIPKTTNNNSLWRYWKYEEQKLEPAFVVRMQLHIENMIFPAPHLSSKQPDSVPTSEPTFGDDSWWANQIDYPHREVK
ncbi:hypothetical protein [Motilimonas pumila]|uniref:Uncharacterized protein n=1 Tax=Motilimonas pumila TaxID=2303987 RepID=A0A418YBL1_9GAMM|nr:hypothetical protein [Motilimonas pumila]RJG41895.1 hypothetical protein D1Z90_15495 [Motilimonas pumila]